jgi:hypothetical protein
MWQTHLEDLREAASTGVGRAMVGSQLQPSVVVRGRSDGRPTSMSSKTGS